jgi:polysaccharide biosynthesis transport protein
MQENGMPQEAVPAMSLREYGDILRRRRAIILQTFLIILVGGILLTIFMPAVYQTRARLLVTPSPFILSSGGSGSILDNDLQSSTNLNIPTHMQILQGEEVQKLALRSFDGKKLPDMNIKDVEGSTIIEITSEGENAEAIAKGINALLDAYQEYVKTQENSGLTQAMRNAKDQLNKYDKDVNRTQKELETLTRINNLADLKEGVTADIKQQAEIQMQFGAAQRDLQSLQTQIVETQRTLATLPQTQTEITTSVADTRVQAATERLAELEAAKKAFMADTNLGTENPEYKEQVALLTAQIASTKSRLSALEGNYQTRESKINPERRNYEARLRDLRIQEKMGINRVNSLRASAAQAKNRTGMYPKIGTSLLQMQSSLGFNTTQKNEWQKKVEELELRLALKRERTQIIERASVPSVPIRPKKAQNILFAGILGLFLGLGLALLQELFDDRINSPEEAERVLRLPNLGHVPMVEEEGLRLIRDISTFSPLMEAYRSLRTNINFAAVGSAMRSIVVTSSAPAEGKSTTVANLAMAMALDGKKVIIVDADLRRPSQHKLFKIDSSPGLTDVLVGTHDVNEVMRPSGVDGVQIIPAGSPPPNPAELLGSLAMEHLIARLETIADVILFDTPPALAVADAIVLSSRTNGTLLVIGYGESKKANTRKAQELLSRANANLLGTVLNRMDAPSSGYYYGKYYVPATVESSGRRVTGSSNDAQSARPAALSAAAQRESVAVLDKEESADKDA